MNVKITGVPSFKEATLIEDALRELIGESGQIEAGYKDKTLEMKVVSGKTARDIAVFLSEKGIEIDGIASQNVDGSLKEKN